jgi:hypothetical protein
LLPSGGVTGTPTGRRGSLINRPHAVTPCRRLFLYKLIARCRQSQRVLPRLDAGKSPRHVWHVISGHPLTAELPHSALVLIIRHYWDGAMGCSMTRLVKVFGCRQASENRPSTNPRGCGDGLWGFRVLRGWGSCAAGSVWPLAGARCVRFAIRRMMDCEPAAAGRQQLSADPNAGRALGHSLQWWCCGVT